MRKPCENPKKTKKNKFCNEMQHKATQEDFPCVPKATKQWNQNLSKSKEKPVGMTEDLKVPGLIPGLGTIYF